MNLFKTLQVPEVQRYWIRQARVPICFLSGEPRDRWASGAWRLVVCDGRCRHGPSSLRACRGCRRGASGGEVRGDFRSRLSGWLPSARFARGSGYGRVLVSSCPRPRRHGGRQSAEKARSKRRQKLTQPGDGHRELTRRHRRRHFFILIEGRPMWSGTAIFRYLALSRSAG